MFFIEDGTGQGYKAKVSSGNKLEVSAVTSSIQHAISADQGQAYQVIGMATLAAGTTVCLHIQNTSSSMHMDVTYIRHQILDPSGGTSFPNASNYFRIAFGRTYASGGSIVTPVNVNQAKGNIAGITVYDSGPTLIGTALEIDRWYTKSEGDMNALNKEGAVIIEPNRTIELAYVGDRSGGTIYSRLSFLMREI